tara:strand:- start:1523 stop:1822 length:300 start_codon:yes stop_codon:yes gene_type:complete
MEQIMDKLYKCIDNEMIELTAEEYTEYNELQIEDANRNDERIKGSLRSRREPLLEEADWEINKKIDNNEDATSWKVYRQALRDITSGDLNNPNWPTKPS